MFSSLPSEDPHIHLHNVVFICKSMIGHQNMSIDVVGLRIFLVSLSSEATLSLFELSRSSISTWVEMQKAFLERYFLKSKKLKLKDYINKLQENTW